MGCVYDLDPAPEAFVDAMIESACRAPAVLTCPRCGGALKRLEAIRAVACAASCGFLATDLQIAQEQGMPPQVTSWSLNLSRMATRPLPDEEREVVPPVPPPDSLAARARDLRDRCGDVIAGLVEMRADIARTEARLAAKRSPRVRKAFLVALALAVVAAGAAWWLGGML